MAEKIRKAFMGADAVAYAMKQINPDVVAAYPITPQTEIMHEFAKYVADGDVQTDLVTVESEHSAMSATVGASAAGARAMTATAANGLALMWEIVYIAASTKLPIVMNVVNRALSGPINIHCDHSDSMGCRDSGWIQFYSESAEEAYENTILAVKLAEHPDIRLPVMVCQDGFITSHAVEDIEVLDDESVNNFIGEFQATYPLLDVDNPVTYGPLDFFDYYFEHKRQQIECMDHVIETYKKIADEFGQLIGKKLDTIEEYYMGDAEIAICVMSSSAGTTRIVVDEFRKKGIKAGMLKIRMFRPFPAEDITKWLGKVKAVAVLDRSASFGAVGGPIFNEVRAAFYEWKEKPLLKNHIFGLGGRELDLNLITSVYNDLQEVVKNQNVGQLVNYLGVRD